MQTEQCDPDLHHRAFFSFEPSLFLADLGNIVSCCYCTNSIPAFRPLLQLRSQLYMLLLQALDYSISGIHQLER